MGNTTAIDMLGTAKTFVFKTIKHYVAIGAIAFSLGYCKGCSDAKCATLDHQTASRSETMTIYTPIPQRKDQTLDTEVEKRFQENGKRLTYNIDQRDLVEKIQD